MKYKALPASLYIENRKRLVAQLPTKSLAIFNSNDEMPRVGDQTHDYRQNSDLLYLSGIDQESSILILAPNHPLVAYREMLFLKKTSALIAIWEGHKYTIEEAQAQSGIQTIMWAEDFKNILPVLMHHSNEIFLNSNENDRYVHSVPYADLRFIHQLQQTYPLHRYHRLAPIMAALRSIKQEAEINAMQIACDITEKAFRRVLGFVKPGVAEYEIEAEIIHEFIRNRATGHAYHPIIASGANACVLHYNTNNMVCNDGDVILMDFGAEYANYAADLTRCIPVNGKFTARQKDVYNAVLRVMKAAAKMLLPGNTIEAYHQQVGLLMEAELIGLGLLKAEEVAQQNPAQPLYKKYFMHGTSHFLGLDIHDIGNKYLPMQAGMVFTVEPGIYIPEENLGIRIENDYLITTNGQIDLMQNIPIEADDIEMLMQG
ncbi:MAG: aminopeptidase P family protein [Bacteroidia bacterium]|nr:aminopeptidase P family protein [Bacteroidia bacterium]